jgi:hypothetical protein
MVGAAVGVGVVLGEPAGWGCWGCWGLLVVSDRETV